jgi:hypothetical protein
MSKKLSSCILLLLLCNAANAQSTFVKYYYDVGVARVNLNELSSGNYLTGFAEVLGSGISLLDAQGNELHSQGYAIDTVRALQSVKRYTDNEFVFVGGYQRDSCTVSQGALRTDALVGRMDSIGNMYNIFRYVFNFTSCGPLMRNVEVMSNGDAVAFGGEAFGALRVNAAGDVVWAKALFQHWRDGFRFFKELPGGDLIAGINADTAGVVVARMTAGGEFIWVKSYIRPRGMIADCVVESDDAFVITGYTDSIMETNIAFPPPPDYHPKLFLMKLNGDGEIQWCKGYDSEPIGWFPRNSGAYMSMTIDGNYAILANLRYPGLNISYRPFLMKVNQNGDTLWTRAYGRTDYAYDILNLLACADGGFMMNGQAYGLGAYIFKTDSLGYLPCYNRWHPVVVEDLFPTDSSFTLNSVDGAVKLPAYITYTETDPLQVIEPCGPTATWQPTERPEKRRMSIRPNPNTGHFTLSFPDPLIAESYYSVYDTMGKLLFQRPLPKGKQTEEVDLTRFGAGTYVVRFTSKEGSCYERVVVE